MIKYNMKNILIIAKYNLCNVSIMSKVARTNKGDWFILAMNTWNVDLEYRLDWNNLILSL